jgi:hypothetical protein
VSWIHPPSRGSRWRLPSAWLFWLQEAAALGHGGLRQLMSFEYRWKVRKHLTPPSAPFAHDSACKLELIAQRHESNATVRVCFARCAAHT